MFLRYNTRKKDGKGPRYWRVVENRRRRPAPTIQRPVLYLGEINDPQQSAWRKSLEVLNETTQRTEQIWLFPEDRDIPPEVLNGLQVKLSELTLQPPRLFGDCWLACRLWDDLHRGPFGRERRPEGKAQGPWFKVLEPLTVRQRVAPGSQGHLPRHWFVASARDQLFEEDFAVAAKNRRYEWLDRIDAHRAELFTHLQARWKELFGATYDRLLYDLTRTCFEGELEQAPKAQRGYSRDKRPDCRQGVIAVVLSPAGFPNAPKRSACFLFGRPPPVPAGISSKTHGKRGRGKNCAPPAKSNCSATATKSLCWPRARAGAPRKSPSAAANWPSSGAACARYAAPGSDPGNATRSCTSWAPRTKQPAERGAS
jgi:hypothetical protein